MDRVFIVMNFLHLVVVLLTGALQVPIIVLILLNRQNIHLKSSYGLVGVDHHLQFGFQLALQPILVQGKCFLIVLNSLEIGNLLTGEEVS